MTKPFAHRQLRIVHTRLAEGNLSSGYYPDQVAKAYGFPAGFNPGGIRIGVIELGGSNYASDLQTFCSARGLPVPTVTQVPVGGVAITPDPGNADVEVMLDIEMIASAFPGAAIRAYFADNSEAGFIAAVQQALAECDAVSCSWGAPENQWSASGLQQLACDIAAAVGKPFTVASGDSGSSDGESGNNVDFPGSAPGSIDCGGTSLASLTNLASESAWGDGGGGISSVFGKPSYQSGETLSGSMRGCPDVAGSADPNYPYNIYCNGQWMQVGGTSAVAPLVAALCGLLKAQAGSLPGDLHPFLYQAGTCRDIVGGSDGTYSAGVGYDLVTGNGVPIPSALLAALTGTASPLPPAPPPSPPPVPPPSPPPVPSPPPSPPPPPPSGSLPVGSIMAAIDAGFAIAIDAAQNCPLAVEILQELQADLDEELPPILRAAARRQAAKARVKNMAKLLRAIYPEIYRDL